jgi:hypothetical protein
MDEKERENAEAGRDLIAAQQQFKLAPTSLNEAIEYSKLIAGSSLAPKGYEGKPGDVLIAVQMGAEFGLQPLQALQNIAVINQRPCMWGDAVKGLVEASGLLEYCRETWDEETQTATCIAKRAGKPEPISKTFSIKDAERAGLASRDTYKRYPQRMCQMRARSWVLRDEFADVLKGLRLREEEEDQRHTESVRKIPMPARQSETDSELEAAVSSYLKEQEGGGKKPKATKGQPPAEQAQQVWAGQIEKVTVRDGKTGKKSWTLYTVHTGDGRFTTFDKTMAEEAKRIKEADELAEIIFVKTDKGNNLEAIGPLEEHAE